MLIIDREAGRIKLSYFFRFFTTGHQRSIQIKKNAVIAVVLRGGGLLCGFIQVPITLHYLGATDYGIWITVGSFISLLNFFDVGLSDGLRNKFAQALAENDHELAKSYVSTTYILISAIMLVLYLVFLLVYQFINWHTVLNAPEKMGNTIDMVVFIVFTSFVLTFIFKIIQTIVTADQKPAFVELFRLCSSILTLAAIYTLTKTTEGSLVYVCLSFGAVPILVYLCFSFYFFSKGYKNYTPSFKYFNISYVKELTSLGIKFFVIHISALILYSSDNIIVAQVLGPKQVTLYQIAFKYFSIISMIFLLIANPLWSSFTDAYYRNDINWIKKAIKNFRLVSFGLSIVVIFMVVISNIFYEFWVGPNIKIPFMLSVLFGINAIIMMHMLPYVFFINGTGIIKLQLYVGLLEALINIPLSIYLAVNVGLGLVGVILATSLSNGLTLIIWPIQYSKIINGTAAGIWAK